MEKETWKNEIVNSLAGMERAQPSPFLFTRIEGRLQDATRLSAWQLRVATAALVALLAVNVWALYGEQQGTVENSSSLSTIKAY
jgi:hypothetical protein